MICRNLSSGKNKKNKKKYFSMCFAEFYTRHARHKLNINSVNLACQMSPGPFLLVFYFHAYTICPLTEAEAISFFSFCNLND